MRLSICMMVKNEEKNLERCLKSQHPLREALDSELIIIDTGSTDSTVQIAERFTEQVYLHPWDNDFSGMRNKSISYAKGDWILIIDADEEILDAAAMINFLTSEDSKLYGSAGVTVISPVFEESQSVKSVFVQCRLFKNDGCFRYEGTVHNQPKFKGETITLETSFMHYGYIATDKELMDRKFLRTSTLLKSELEKDPQNVYYRFQLSTSYKMHGDIVPALSEILLAYDQMRKQKLNPRANLNIYYQLVICLIDNERYEAAEQKCIEGLQIEKDHIDLYYYLAAIEAKFGKNELAIKDYETYLKLVADYDNLAARKDCAFYTLGRVEEVQLKLAGLYLKKGNHARSLANLEHVTAKEFAPNVIDARVKLLIAWDKLTELKEFFLQTVAAGNPFSSIIFDALETQKNTLEQDARPDFLRLFSNGSSEYERLNSIRLAFSAGNAAILDQLDSFVQEANLNACGSFFADVLYYALRLNGPLGKMFRNVSEDKLNDFFNYLRQEYKDLDEHVERYLDKFSPANLPADARMNKVLARHTLLAGKLQESAYKSVFLKYVSDGMLWVRKTYSEFSLQSENVSLLNDHEAGFFIYLALAEEARKTSESEYVRYLRQALQAYPAMSKGIELLLQELKLRQQQKEEFEKYRVAVKEAISNFIARGQLKEAWQVINEYEQIVEDDVQVQSMKAVILVLEGDLSNADRILQEALIKYPKDFNLLYNMGYVYQKLGKFEDALKTYEVARSHCVEPKLIQEIEEALSGVAAQLSLAIGRK